MSDLLRTVGVVLVVAGAMALASPQFAYSSVTADRAANVGVAADTNAYLGIDANGDIGELRGDDNPQPVATLTNNLGQTVDVDVRVENIPGASDDILSAYPNGASISPGNAKNATVECNTTDSVGQKNVTFGVDATGPSVSIVNATFTVTIDIQCGKGQVTQTGLTNVHVSDLNTSETGQTQTIEFELTEDLAAGENVTIELLKVERGNNRLDYSGATVSTGANGTVTDARPGNDYVVEFQAGETLSAGETVTITVDGVDAGNRADTYNADFQRSDKGSAASTQFEVA